MKKTAPAQVPESPIDFGPLSNGEFLPLEPTPRERFAEREVQDAAEHHGRRLGLSRREFLRTPAGMAAALFALNNTSACRPYQVSPVMVADPNAAAEAIGGTEFIFDCQTHHVNATEGAEWTRTNAAHFDLFREVSAGQECGRAGVLACLARETYAHEIFVASDTDIALLSGVPAARGKNPLGNDEIRATRDLISQLGGQGRLLAQGVVYPNGGPDALDDMQALEEEMHVVGWKVYTPWGPSGVGFWLDDPSVGLPFLERVRRSASKIVFCHKGLPWPIWDGKYASPRDIGPVARQYPDIRFVVYHSGFEPSVEEGPFRRDGNGVDRLIQSCAQNGIGAGKNVYAELGGTWAVLMRKPDQAAHVIGKLLRQFGEDRLLWGTDALFVGVPQPQIEAFRAFQIPEEMRERWGYPALNRTARAKVLGLNAARLLKVQPATRRHQLARDPLALRRHDPDQRFPLRATGYGPRTAAAFFAQLASRGFRP
jgi:predicted TIM-barrel fold metal-dependent hydrolase